MDFEKAKLNAAAVFKSSEEVVSSQELSREQKIEILQRWEQDARVDGSRGGRKHARPATQTAPTDSRRSENTQTEPLFCFENPMQITAPVARKL